LSLEVLINNFRSEFPYLSILLFLTLADTAHLTQPAQKGKQTPDVSDKSEKRVGNNGLEIGSSDKGRKKNRKETREMHM